MIKKIITDKELLKKKSIPCDVRYITDYITDLIDTARHSPIKALGLAGNQIGILERIFIVKTNSGFHPIINPEVVSKGSKMNYANETCLSLPNEKPIRKKRHNKIKIKYYSVGQSRIVKKVFRDLEARVVQHEMDHFEGILI